MHAARVTRGLSEQFEGVKGGRQEDSCEGRSREFNDIPDYDGTWREKRRKMEGAVEE